MSNAYIYIWPCFPHMIDPTMYDVEGGAKLDPKEVESYSFYQHPNGTTKTYNQTCTNTRKNVVEFN